MIDVKQLEADAKAEVDQELAAAAKARIKGKLKEIAAAERVLVNLRADYAAIMRDVGSA